MMGVMRPPGVQDRIRQLLENERDAILSRSEYTLRAHLTDFIALCAGLWYWDQPVNVVLQRYRDAWRYIDDPRQRRTGTDFESRSVACVRELRPEVGQLADFVEAASFEEQDAAVEPLLRIPPGVLLGEVGPDCYFHLACWNEANALAERVQTPYRAARRVINMRIHEPPDVYGLIPPLSDLVERYEDEPDARPATGATIEGVFSGYRERVPWPLS
jgi:hypothetical protein